MLEPVMTMREGARIYSPAGVLLRPNDLLLQPGLARAFQLMADEGSSTFYSGTIAAELLGLMEERGGLVTAADLAAYRPYWRQPVACEYAGTRVLTRAGLSGVSEALARLPTLSSLATGPPGAGTRSTLGGGDDNGHTTNVTVVDPAGNACVVTTSLGLGQVTSSPAWTST